MELNPQFEIPDEDIKSESEQLRKQTNEDSISENLKIVLATYERLKALKSKEIRFSQPVLTQGEHAVIFPHTINVIQGQAGVHKSRLVENICSAFLKRHNCHNELLAFKRTNYDANYTVVYVDTERNLYEQLPFALQSIQKKAGFDIDYHTVNFEYISLLQIKRKERFDTLNEYLNHIRKEATNPLFIVLDVSTDCIEDFNKTDKSMELIDLMNMAINEHNVVFLCLIHENPKSDKARGHFGTELMNKASTVMQVGFEKDANQNDTEIIRIKYLKCRSTARHAPFHVKYCKEAKELVLADVTEVSGMIESRKHKASGEDMLEFIEMHLSDGLRMTRIEFLDKLCEYFKASRRTIEARIVKLMNSNQEITGKNGESSRLVKEMENKVVYYKLESTSEY